MIIFLGEVSHIAGFPLSALWIYHAAPIWSVKFLQINQLIACGDFLTYITLCFCLSAFRVLSLSLTFAILIMICLGVSLFLFILIGTLTPHFLYLDICFLLQICKFSAIIFSNAFLISFFLFSPTKTPKMEIFVSLMLSQRSLKLFSFKKKFVFLLAVLIGWFPFVYLPDHLCVLLYHLVCYSFIPCSVFFISVIEFFISVWVFFIFSSPC